MATTFQQRTDDTDLLLDENKRLVIERDPVVAAAYKLRNRLQFFKGEWFLDTRVGVPYYDEVFIKNPSLAIIRRLVRRIILSCPPIVAVRKLDMFFLRKERALVYNFEATAEDGRTVSGGSGQPFIVSGN